MPRGRPKKSNVVTPIAGQMSAKEVEIQEIGAQKDVPSSTANASTNLIDTSGADKSLDDAKGKFTVALTIGLLPDGNIDISTNNPNYAVLNWLLDRAQFELLGHEKQNYLNKGKGA